MFLDPMYHGKISLPDAAEFQVNTQGYINMVNMVLCDHFTVFKVPSRIPPKYHK